MILYPGRILIVYDAALLVSVIGLRSDYVISDTDVRKTNKNIDSEDMSGCRGGNVTNNRLLCNSINLHYEDIYIHSVRSTEDSHGP